MDESDPFEVFLKLIADRDREHGIAVLLTLALPDGNLAIFEIDVLYPQPEAFHQPKPRSIEKATHNPEGSIKAGQNSLHLIARKNDRQVLYGCHFGLPSGLSTWVDSVGATHGGLLEGRRDQGGKIRDRGSCGSGRSFFPHQKNL